MCQGQIIPFLHIKRMPNHSYHLLLESNIQGVSKKFTRFFRIEKIHTLLSYRKNSHTFTKTCTRVDLQNIAYLGCFSFVSKKFTHNFVTKKFTHFFVYSPVVFFSGPDFPKFNSLIDCISYVFNPVARSISLALNRRNMCIPRLGEGKEKGKGKREKV